MSEEPHKLVAKIQHFYDIMVKTAEEYEDRSILGEKDCEKHKKYERSVDLRKLIEEYGKVFETFLYKETF